MTTSIGSLIIDLQGQDLAPEEREILGHPLVGGIILFTRNYDSRAQIQHLCQQVRAARKTPLLIMVDQEGGRVQRFIPEFTRLPRMGVLGQLFDKDPDLALRVAKDCGWLMAAELLSVGVDLSLAPVLDMNKGISNVIGERAFHSNPQVIISLTKAFMQGMEEAGMAATGKHFPGHGSVSVDSHIAIPVDERTLADIEKEDLIPFTGLIQAGIPAIMAAHIIFPKVDKVAVGFSSRWLQDILRKQLGFNGVIFSDDLNMEGANISANYADRVVATREAGCDFALLCNNRQGVIQALDGVPYAEHKVQQEKWGVLQGKFSPVKDAYRSNPKWQEACETLLNFTQTNA